MSAPTQLVPPVVIAHGAPPKLITSYAPGPDADDSLTVINLGTERVWLSNDSTAGPGGGVPLEGGTSTAWTLGGTLYGIADTDNQTDVTLVLTAAVTDYRPSPYAVAVYAALQIADSALAAETAAAIAGETLVVDASGHVVAVDASGDPIPIAQSGTIVYTHSGTFGSLPAATPVTAVGNNNTLAVVFDTLGDGSGTYYDLEVDWFDDAAGANKVAVDHIMSNSDTDGASPLSARLDVKGRYFSVTPTSGGSTVGTATLTLTLDTTTVVRDSIAGASYLAYPYLYVASGAAATINAGQTVTRPAFLPAQSKVSVSLGGSGAGAGKIVAQLWARTTPHASQIGLPDAYLGSVANSGTPMSAEFDVPFGAALYLLVTNSDTVSRNPFNAITDVSPR